MKLFKFSRASGEGSSEGLNPEGRRGDWRRDRSYSNEELREQLDRLHELAVLSLFLHSAGTLEEMLSLFLERASRATGAVVTYPLLLDKRREMLTAMPLATIDDRGLEQASIAAGDNLADLEFPLQVRSWRRSVMEGGEVVVCNDLHEVMGDVLSKQACDQMKVQLELSKVVVVPLVMEGEAYGICVFMFAGVEPDVEVLELAAGHCTLVLKALTFGEETTRFGGLDPVTWAHSRGHFLEALENDVLRARRYGRGLSLVFFDIDDFSEFNTNYGHTLGDRLLRALAMTLAGSVAPPEMVARYGGDQFALLLPESNSAQAVQLTCSIIQRLEALSIFETDSLEPTGISTSVAIVSYPEDGSTRDELLAAAEIALEQAKAERRAERAPQRQLTDVQQLRLAGRRHTA